MLYNRQKILLALVREFGGQLKKTEFQKFLFLFSTLQSERSYHFVPYKYGCFSFQAAHDKEYLINAGYLLNQEDWVLATDDDFRLFLAPPDADAVRKTRLYFGSLRGDSLIRHVYKTYPYYAINSRISDKLLSHEEQQAVESHKPKKSGRILCSIGYEGKSLEEFLNILIKENIHILCDVRKNPISRKYGFSGKTLMNALSSLGIDYIHYPSLGIDSEKRKMLATQADYDKLFLEYETTVLKHHKETLRQLCDVIVASERAAVMCYEQIPAQCHRTRVVKAVLNSGLSNIDLIEV